jgi:histidinol-phosphate aminotransferase
MQRRKLLKSGLFTLGALSGLPQLSLGAFANQSVELDTKGNIIRSPMVREVLPGFRKDPPALLAKLNANENPYGPSDAAQKAVMESVVRGNRYAWQELFDLVEKIAQKEGVPANHIMMGPGSSDLLEKVALIAFMKGGNLVSADPTYMSLVNVSKAVGATWKAVPCKADWSHDLKAMEAAIDSNTKLVYICNPNNPTGAVTNGDELYDFCSRVSEKVPVFVDEAYMELAGNATRSMVGLVAQKKNIIVARTFSKVMGLAGIRVGYMAAQPEFISKIDDITRGGMGIAYTSIFAANASMDDVAFQQMTIERNNKVKKYCCEHLEKMGYQYIPSHTNFVLFPIAIPGKKFLESMTAKGVGVRAFVVKGKPWCRVSMGTMEEMELFVSTLKAMS